MKQRVAERRIPYSDLLRLQRWAATEPEAPQGNWWKDFGSFTLCGTAELPKTILLPHMKPFGDQIE
ncbi:MAG: hypothetical protein WB992_11365 [Bryobacteraceae bacterium]